MKYSVSEEIRNAVWTIAPAEFISPVIMRKVVLERAARAEIALSSLGFFVLYVNGKRVGDDLFAPGHSIYHDNDFSSMTYPIHDKLTFRAYYVTYDISDYLIVGENTVEIHLGNGFYRQSERICEGDWRYGDSLGTIYAISLSDKCSDKLILSDGDDLVRDSAIVYSELFIGEVYDARIDKNHAYNYARTHGTLLPDTILTACDFPLDRVADRIIPKLIFEDSNRRVYDVGVNISGLAVIKTSAPYASRVCVRFSENIDGDFLDFHTTDPGHLCASGRKQIMEDVFISDGSDHIYRPEFVWHAFRYFEIIGNGEPLFVEVIHSDVAISSSFESSSPELNWLYNAFLRTQLNNMHLGFPSDCPHRERLGYTGDGQICSFAAMSLLDSSNFYRKWIRDIFDSQDKVGGHINHTAPFAGGGGGPGGWGCAAIIVPYNYYKAFGDKTPLYENYEGMKSWISYLVSHSDRGLVTCEEEGGWALGDWCTLDECIIPTDFVNTVYLIKSLDMLLEISSRIDRDADVAYYSSLRAQSVRAIIEKYFDEKTGSFAMGIQGADAYALYVSLGDARTRQNLIEKYEKLGKFDTGFLGTYILCGVLLDIGAHDTLYRMLAGHGLGSFGYMMDRDATTVWEHWRGDGSHDHPMFGASAHYLLTDILGITQAQNSFGYDELLINPKIPSTLKYARGSMRTPKGDVSVAWVREDGRIRFDIRMPVGVSACFRYNEHKMLLVKSKNNFFCEEK